MSARTCSALVRDGHEYVSCGKPATWYLEHVGRADADYWACDDCAREALLYSGADCSDAVTGDSAELDDDGELRRAS